jgi:hypothetical protein
MKTLPRRCLKWQCGKSYTAIKPDPVAIAGAVLGYPDFHLSRSGNGCFLASSQATEKTASESDTVSQTGKSVAAFNRRLPC